MTFLNAAAYAPPWMLTIFHVAVTTAVVKLIQKLFDSSRALNRWIEEFFSVFQTIVVSHELGVIRRAYGVECYCVAVFLSCFLYGWTFRRYIYANPVVTFHRYIYERTMTTQDLLLHFANQVAGAYVAYRYVYFAWTSEYAETHHKQQHLVLSPCKSFITVSLVNAILIETAITFFVRLVAHGERRLPFGGVFPALAVVGGTMAGFAYTGGFFNPTLAFSMQYNCSGHDNWEFMAVYVFGPLIASYLVGLYGDSIWRLITPRNSLTTQ